MEHQTLYRKWRPKTFDDVVGQQHVTQTIKNEIKNKLKQKTNKHKAIIENALCFLTFSVFALCRTLCTPTNAKTKILPAFFDL